MFIVNIDYLQPLDVVDQYLKAHRDFLSVGYERNFLMASGPKQPRTGGIILSQLTSREQLENFLKDDPFVIHKIINYEIIEFNPVKYHPIFAAFIGS